MIRGVSFKTTKKKDKLLKEILDSINVSKYNWYNIESQNEAWSFSDSGEKEFLEDIHYQGKLFGEIINKKHYVIFLKLEAYLGETNLYDIHTYEEFQNSECEILLLIYDCKFIEVFAKEEDIIRNIYENARKKEFDEIEYITDMNDGRTNLDVL